MEDKERGWTMEEIKWLPDQLVMPTGRKRSILVKESFQLQQSDTKRYSPHPKRTKVLLPVDSFPNTEDKMAISLIPEDKMATIQPAYFTLIIHLA